MNLQGLSLGTPLACPTGLRTVFTWFPPLPKPPTSPLAHALRRCNDHTSEDERVWSVTRDQDAPSTLAAQSENEREKRDQQCAEAHFGTLLPPAECRTSKHHTDEAKTCLCVTSFFRAAPSRAILGGSAAEGLPFSNALLHQTVALHSIWNGARAWSRQCPPPRTRSSGALATANNASNVQIVARSPLVPRSLGLSSS